LFSSKLRSTTVFGKLIKVNILRICTLLLSFLFFYYRNFVQKSLPEIRMLNQNTFFTVTEIDHNFKAASACHILYNDCKWLVGLGSSLVAY
jgi:hypothetical protein